MSILVGGEDYGYFVANRRLQVRALSCASGVCSSIGRATVFKARFRLFPDYFKPLFKEFHSCDDLTARKPGGLQRKL